MALDPYEDRARLSVMLAKQVLKQGGVAGRTFDNACATNGDEEGWGHILMIQLEEGQISYHFAPSDVHLLEDLPVIDLQWDGTFNGRSNDFVKGIKI